MPDDDIVRRAFLLDVAPVSPRPFVGWSVNLPALPDVSLDQETFERTTPIVQQIAEVFRDIARALCDALRQMVDALQRAFPTPLLVELQKAERHERRMEAHRHRTAGRPRSRRRRGRR